MIDMYGVNEENKPYLNELQSIEYRALINTLPMIFEFKHNTVNDFIDSTFHILDESIKSNILPYDPLFQDFRKVHTSFWTQRTVDKKQAADIITDETFLRMPNIMDALFTNFMNLLENRLTKEEFSTLQKQYENEVEKMINYGSNIDWLKKETLNLTYKWKKAYLKSKISDEYLINGDLINAQNIGFKKAAQESVAKQREEMERKNKDTNTNTGTAIRDRDRYQDTYREEKIKSKMELRDMRSDINTALAPGGIWHRMREEGLMREEPKGEIKVDV
jgi:hypothetical protein